MAKVTVKSSTNWQAFKDANLVPKSIECYAYQPVHRHAASCHSKLLTTSAAQMIAHLDGDHGGGFEMLLRFTEGAAWPGWDELTAAGIECVDLRSANNNDVLSMNPAIIVRYMQPHINSNKRMA